MKIKMRNGRSATPGEIARFEGQIGHSLPLSFLEFVRKHDGAEPETNLFKIGEAIESGVNGFIPIGEILVERANIEGIPSTLIPVAWAEGGNYVLLDLTSGVLLFWDHEQPNFKIRLVSDFASFIGMLEPFDPASIKLRPGQVESVWIDPDFLKSLGPE